jgi:Fe-S-cluster containining protein
VPVAPAEWEAIRNYVARMDQDEKARLKAQTRGPLTCPFRDVEKMRCAVYPVRPVLCRMYGLYQYLECPLNPQVAVKPRKKARKRLERVYGPGLRACAGVLGETLGWDEGV